MKTRFVRVQIDNISIFNYNFIVLLKRDGDEHVLPICIGPAEAHSIAIAYNKKPYRRPLTHDLM
jgi:bifunctional DNase/RNase